jgi:hypothetical protein
MTRERGASLTARHALQENGTRPIMQRDFLQVLKEKWVALPAC